MIEAHDISLKTYLVIHWTMKNLSIKKLHFWNIINYKDLTQKRQIFNQFVTKDYFSVKVFFQFLQILSFMPSQFWESVLHDWALNTVI